jgi:hypothetical protein
MGMKKKSLKYFLYLLLLCFIPLKSAAQSKLVIVLRVDDVLSRNTEILPRTITPFQNAVEQRGGKVTWLVIPHRLIESANADGSLVRELKTTVSRGHEVAQHGYNHICLVCGQSGHEMWCPTRPLLYGEQMQLIQSGRKLLQDSIGVTAALFVSPGHNEDSTTYRALTDNGFPWISTTKSVRNDIFNGLYNLPSDAEYTWSMTDANYRPQLESALNHIRAEGETQGCYTLLFHDYFIRQGYAGGIVVRWIGEVMDSLNLRYGNRVQYMTLSGAAQYFKTVTSLSPIDSPVIPSLTSQNYPNPFNPSTTIRYGLPSSSNVTVKVFNILGEQIADLVNAEQSAGWHETTWDASVASGVYFYRIAAVSLSEPGQRSMQMKKMILLK